MGGILLLHLLQCSSLVGVVIHHIVVLVAVWFGVIFIRLGDYQEGIFRFSLHIPENFPDGPVPVSAAVLVWFSQQLFM